MPPAVARLYRFPVKGMTAERAEHVRVRRDGGLEGDRVLAFLRTSAVDRPDLEDEFGGRWRKQRFTALMSAPGIARLAARFDPGCGRLMLALDGRMLAEGDVGLTADRARLADAVTSFVEELGGSGLAPDDGYTLIGDGETPRFQDHQPCQVSLVGSGSLEAVEEELDPPLDERRFRMNITLDGLPAWQELDWVGRTVHIGTVTFEVTSTITRCVATHANPETGTRDQDVMRALIRARGGGPPTLGVLAEARAAGEIAVGDAATVRAPYSEVRPRAS